MTAASGAHRHVELDEIALAPPIACATDAADVPLQAYGVTIGQGRREIRAASARAGAVAKLRELADALERGDLDGARVEWRAGLGFLTTVEMDGRRGEPGEKRVALLRYEIITPDRPADPAKEKPCR